MTCPGGAAKLPEMPDIDPIHLALELSAWPDPISGHLSDSHGRARDFHGWLGLAAALEALAGTAAEEDPKG